MRCRYDVYCVDTVVRCCVVLEDIVNRHSATTMHLTTLETTGLDITTSREDTSLVRTLTTVPVELL